MPLHPSTVGDRQFSGPCVVIGSGPSQRVLDDCPQWRDFFAISCNFSQLRYASPLWAFRDEQFLQLAGDHNALASNLAVHFLSNPEVQAPFSLPPWLRGFVCRFRATTAVTTWPEQRSSELLVSLSSTTGALTACLAHCWGFSPIVLVGFDVRDGGWYDYRSPHPVHGMRNQRAQQRHGWRQSTFFKRYAKRLNLVNCSDGDWGQKRPLADVLAAHEPNAVAATARLHQLYEQAVVSSRRP